MAPHTETVNEADDFHVRPEHAREEERPDGEDHVGADIMEKGSSGEDANRSLYLRLCW